MLSPVVQQEATGCGIAIVATILGKSYPEMKAIANASGIHAEDESLWSDTGYVRRLLTGAGVQVATETKPFESWDTLPDLALLPIKHHQRDGREFWHWTVFQRVRGEAFVLDPASYLPSNIRQDFAQMHPQWFITVGRSQA
ncbi:hypothetical protein [Thiopseudomonas denitrificans]|uniref:Peptidase C39-like protein n=1 Tax=Thiopseudomonas denitrificans TaxID=1501432 RepID=A0A4R6TUA3_9GAMM|nr:hypothetical protein [Thiopseudomonas denitrificans]TDQ37290.1 hypothetical protein DFQ45_10870 [Thiopseudomonas denitrificans]